MKRYLRLIGRLTIMSLKVGVEYRGTLMIMTVWQFGFLALTVLFWKVIFLRTSQFAGWTFKSVLVLHFFSQLFSAIFNTFFLGSHVLWRVINQGKLDSFLVRPVDPRLLAMGTRFNIVPAIERLVNGVALLALILYVGSPVNWLNFFLALFMVTTAVLLFSMVQATGNYLTFWWGSSDAVDEFLDSLFPFIRYPLTTMPPQLQMVMTFAVPLVFAATMPALFTTGAISRGRFALTSLVMVGVGVMWWFIQDTVWKRGLARYESAGG
ncbi:MAG: ABC-2 family transporter protein [Candidatus Wallbacteria bacterium]|nr:ABC-2 family transporter protein [Candidatus Wallbacteria bacterium]